MHPTLLLLATLLFSLAYLNVIRRTADEWREQSGEREKERERVRESPVPTRPPCPDDRLTFYAVWTTAAGVGTGIELDWRQEAAFASVFATNPCASVRLYSNAISNSTARAIESRFAACAQDFRVVRYDLPSLLRGTPAASFADRVAARRDLGPNWYSNESNLLRFLLLHLHGGVYMDTDVIFVRDAATLAWSTLGWESDTWVNGAVLKFPQGSPFLADCLREFAKNFRGTVWGYNGPKLLTRMLSSSPAKDEVTVLPVSAFYMFHYQTASARCFEATTGPQFETDRATVRDEAIAVHLSNKVTHTWGTPDHPLREGTICFDLFHSYAPRCGGERADHVDEARTSR
jgi:lactosylceramide 4-alpha-galactosyltransferase